MAQLASASESIGGHLGAVFYLSEPEEPEVIGVAQVVSGNGGQLIGVERLNEFGRNDNQQLGFGFDIRDRTEQGSQNGKVSKSGYSAGRGSSALAEQTGNGKGLAATQFNSRVGVTNASSRNGEAGDGNGVGEVRLGYFRGDLQTDEFAGQYRGHKAEPYAILTEFDGDGVTFLDHGDGVFAASQEAGLSPVQRDQRRFSKNVHQVVILHSDQEALQVGLG